MPQLEKAHEIPRTISAALDAVQITLCQDVGNGVIGPRDAQRTYGVSANLNQLWLTQFDRGELSDEEVEASGIAEYEMQIAALERKVGQLTMELDLVKKTPRQPIADDNESSSIVTSLRPAPSDGGYKMIDLPRSTYYYRSTARALNLGDTELIEDIQDDCPATDTDA